MKRVFVIAFLLMVALSRAQSVVYLNSTDNIGTSRTNLNGNFSNLLPFVQAGYSNRIDRVGVTNEPAGTSFIVTNGTERWMLFGTNDTGGASVPQSPWTNWVEASNYGVSNAGTYNVASTNSILLTLGTNRLTIQGTASEPTNVAWNGNSLWNVGGSGAGGYWTNYVGFHIVYKDTAPTNQVWVTATTTNMQLVVNETNVIFDSGETYIGRKFVDATNGIFYAPVGYNILYFSASDGAGPGGGADEPIWLQVNEGNASSVYWGALSVGSTEFGPPNRINAAFETGYLQGQLLWYNTAQTNKYRLFGKQSSGANRYNFFQFNLRMEYRGVRP